ncbi:MAG: biotin/lipoyl-binding protein, partial [Pseudomonadota bacterium]
MRWLKRRCPHSGSRRHRAAHTLLTATAILLAGCDQSAPVEEELLRPVRYLTVSDNVSSRERTFSGLLKSTRETRLSFKVAGTITRLPVQIGQRLKRGALIAELEDDSFRLQVEQSQATLVEAEAGQRN